MKRWTLLLALFALTAPAASKLTRVSIAAMEKDFDNRLTREVLDDDPFALLGMTRGVHVEGLGIVYSAEVNLAQLPGISPFHPEMTKADWARIRQKKLQRVPVLRTAMKQMLLNCAASLDGVPTEEVVALGVTLTRHPSEDSAGLPSQIVVQALKRDLIDVQAGRRDRAQLDTLIKVREF